jgi:hypothetical protein
VATLFRPIVSLIFAGSLASTLIPTLSGGTPQKPDIQLHWLENKAPADLEGATWGLPWPMGTVKADASFALSNAEGKSIPVQSWPLATWPDGSLKWSAHALPADLAASSSYQLKAGAQPQAPEKALVLTDSAEAVLIDTGIVTTRILKQGDRLIDRIEREGKAIAADGRLVCLVQDRPEAGGLGIVKQEPFTGAISSVTVEQSGPVRAVVRIQGKHKSQTGERAWLPFTVRLYFYAGSQAIRVMHTIIFDGDENKDFIRGLGLRFSVPLAGPLYDRHVRFSGEGSGLFAEAVQGLTGLRRNPGENVTQAQLDGKTTPALATWPKQVSTRLQYVPTFADWTIFQPNDGSFEIRKRTQETCSWLKSAEGRRAGGLAYLGTPQGGLAFGIRNFWQSSPSQMDIRGATSDKAEVTLWLWAPDAAPMDLRFYHDGMGEDDFDKQNEGLEITYEDYQPGYSRPEGVARTSEIMLWALPATPSRARFVELAETLNTPPLLSSSPENILSAGVFGKLWSLPDRSTPAKARIEDHLDSLFAFYVGQREQRHWYGFWNYGDVMHSYDEQRHVWKYDVGGFAWDNSELSTDIWIWLYYLRSGRADVFRFAEALTRHTGEVDVHHIGRFAPLGSRHNVMHWGCSAKQLRISTAQNRRYYYYLTGDERVGDLLREQVEAAQALIKIQPGRKVSARRGQASLVPTVSPAPKEEEGYANIGFGTDWGALASAWLTEWERTGDTRIRDRLFNSMRTIAAQPHGFFSTGSRMNLETGVYDINPSPRAGASHLSAAFGLPEICEELIGITNMPEFTQAWLQYCTLYGASADEQQSALGNSLGRLNLIQGHARITAFAGKFTDNEALRRRAWKEFLSGSGGFGRRMNMTPKTLQGPDVLTPVDEIPEISTNSSAQWGMAVIECLALAPKELPADALEEKTAAK